MNFEVTKVPYFDIEDTTDEVGITRRQLGHWQDQGLLCPELGAGTNKFTTTDIRRLKALRHLIVDRKFPISLVKELVTGGDEHIERLTATLIETAVLFSDNPHRLYNSIFDFDTKKLLAKPQFAQNWWNARFAIAPEEEVKSAAYDLALLLFRIVRERYRNEGGFVQRRDEILQEIGQLSDTARADIVLWDPLDPETVSVSLLPSLQPDNPNLDHDRLELISLYHQASRLDKFREAITGYDMWFKKTYGGRFWTKMDLNALGAKLFPYARGKLGFPPQISPDASDTEAQKSEEEIPATADIPF